MNVVTDWVKEAFMIILSVTFLEIMLPEGTMAKYLKFIFAIVILAVLLEPINNFMYK